MSEERFSTAAPLPDRIHRLHELALDLWWSWDSRARDVFRHLDYQLWRATAHNPVRMLQVITPERLMAAAADPEFAGLYDQAVFGLDDARTRMHPWWREHAAAINGGSVAYFSAEFALHQSLPIYAGGLGVLAGDHCKEASDLGIPLVGVGFMYPQGYFRQRMSNDGWQEERYERISWTDAPIESAITPDGKPCITAVPLAIVRCSSPSGAFASAACGSSCSTPISAKTLRGIESCPPAFMAAIARPAFSRKSFSASAACER